MAEKYVTMIHKQTGAKITGVHPDSVPAHEAIGYQVVPDEPKAEKSVKTETKVADNETAPKPPKPPKPSKPPTNKKSK